ncbi:thiol-activated cytolysin family protein [Streptomyces sp. NPDC018019]|uniref:thiol-activated cytolysin family protein n=1 Tax=Streptomyces sp. NPDC018019 TaxID=3365030 RepID=UPI00379E075D
MTMPHRPANQSATAENTPAPARSVRDADGTWRVKWQPGVTADTYKLVRRPAEAAQTPSEPHVLDQAARVEDLVVPGGEHGPEKGAYLVYAFRDGAPVRSSALETGMRGGKVDLRKRLVTWAKWDTLAPHEKDGDEAEGDPEDIHSGGVDGTQQKITSTRTPYEILTFTPDANTMWPGQIVRSDEAIKSGKLVPVGIGADCRGTLKIAIDALSAGEHAEVEEPDGAKVLDAIKNAVEGKKNRSPSIALRQTTAYASKELSLDLGISAQFGGFSASIATEFRRKETKNCVALYLRERAFTATSVWQDANDLFSDEFTEEVLDRLENEYKAIGPDNPPLLVSDITYGFVLTAFIHSRTSELELNAAIEASREGFANLDAKVKERYQQVLRQSEISIQSHGGSPEVVHEALVNGTISDYFKGQEQPLEEYAVIGYTLKQLEPNKIAQMSEKTTYDKIQWEFETPGAYKYRLQVKRLACDDQLYLWHYYDTFTCKLGGVETKVHYDDEDKWACAERVFTADGKGKPFTLSIRDSGWEGCVTELTPSGEQWGEDFRGWIKNRYNVYNKWLPYNWSVEVEVQQLGAV